jgi:hypothetical protein
MVLTTSAQAGFTDHILDHAGTLTGPNRVVTADLDGDGDADILTTSNEGSENIVWFENDGCVPPKFDIRHIDTAADPQAVRVGDLDQDGDLDFVVANADDDTIYWYENKGCRPPTFIRHLIPSIGIEPRDIAIADLDHDDDPDVIIAWDIGPTPAQRKISWFENEGGFPLSFTNRLVGQSATMPDAQTLSIADMNDDGHLDIVAAGYDGPTVWFESDGGSLFTWSVHTISLDGSIDIEASDVNDDGCMDVVAVNPVDGDGVILYLGDCAIPGYSTVSVGGVNSGAYGISIEDMDGDGDKDIVAALRFTSMFKLFQNDGAGTPSFASSDIYISAVSPVSVATDDLDADGDMDVVGVSPNDDFLAWFENDLITPEPFCLPVYAPVFSLDIGSDHELSDPNADGNEGFDPGDLYFTRSAPVDWATGGRDGGFLDDLDIFLGTDPWPDAPDAATPPATAVPVGVSAACPVGGPPLCYDQYFDLDATDTINVSLGEMGLGISPVDPLVFRIRYLDLTTNCYSECIYTPDHISISYDDDNRRGWNMDGNNVPINSSSPAGRRYGTTARKDEIMGMQVDLSGMFAPYPMTDFYTVADEASVHASLADNPDDDESSDDDVDALDLLHYTTECSVHLYSVDHEAKNGLIPGAIYEYPDLYAPVGGPPSHRLHPSVHFGLPANVDIDAFELVWLPDPEPDPFTGEIGLMTLAALFSVDDDDPRTPSVDESGTLDPSAIYASYLDGIHFEFIVPSPTGLYGVTWAQEVVKIDRDTGATVQIGTLPDHGNAMAVDSSQRIIVGHADELFQVTVNATGTSATTSVFSALIGRPAGYSIRGMAFDSNDRLYAMLGGGSGDDLLCTIEPYGSPVAFFLPIGTTGETGLQGLAFDDSGTLYAADLYWGLYNINTATGVATDVGDCGSAHDIQALEFDLDGSLLASDNNDLVRLDPSCADDTEVIGETTDGTTTFDIRGLAVIVGLDDDIDAISAAPSRPVFEDASTEMSSPGDFDADGDVDLVDFSAFQLCFTGSGGGPVGPECEPGDTDGDGDVDLIDFGEFQLRFTGS